MVHATGDSNVVLLNQLQVLLTAQVTHMYIYKEINEQVFFCHTRI